MQRLFLSHWINNLVAKKLLKPLDYLLIHFLIRSIKKKSYLFYQHGILVKLLITFIVILLSIFLLFISGIKIILYNSIFRLSITNIKWFIELDPIAASSRVGINKLSRSVSRTHRVSKIKSSKMSRSRLDTFDGAKNRVYIFY